ncbi:MAG: GntR family transcriptional regulator [Deltaproteobacteria bacterium]|nr:GntR family transcriptional regulator [Deltaproteobacteria bacterium]
MAKNRKAKENHGQSITLIDEAYRKLKEMIFRQNVIPGQRLIAKDLSEMLKMSRTPIINALYLLEREGFIVSVPFRGFYVKPVDINM